MTLCDSPLTLTVFMAAEDRDLIAQAVMMSRATTPPRKVRVRLNASTVYVTAKQSTAARDGQSESSGWAAA